MKKIVAVALIVVVISAGLVCAVGIAAATFASDLSGTVVVKDVILENSGEVTTEDTGDICNHVNNVSKVAELYLDNDGMFVSWEVFSPAGNFTEGWACPNYEDVEEAVAMIDHVPENYAIEFDGNVVSRSEAKGLIKQFFNN